MDPSLTDSIEDVRYQDDVVNSFSSLQSELSSRGWSVQSWTDPPNSYHAPHEHPYSHRVLCRSGWIEFTVNGTTHRLNPGDTLDLPSTVTHEATSHPEQPTEYWLLRKNTK